MDTSQYNHSVKVPTQYRTAARLLKKTFEEGASLKGLIFQEKHAKTNRLYALIQKISDQKPVLDRLVADTKLKEREPRLEKYLCAVLMTELLFGAGHLNGDSKPVQCIRKYEPEFRALLAGGSGGGEAGAGEAGQGGTVANGDLPKPMLKREFEKPRYVRINTNLLSRADALELFVKDGWIERPFAADTQTYDEFLEIVRTLGEADFVSDMHVKNLFVFPASSKRFWARNALVKEAKLVLQDKASCLPTVLLDPPRGSTILDMCAAPGMKTSHLAAHIKNKGTIYAVEQHVRRYGTLCEIMANTRSSVSVQTINQDALALEDEGVPGVEYILVDPSCSGSGMTGRLFSTPDEKEADRLVLLSGLQMRMLQHAMRAFHTARKIVYSTCSVYVEENEQVVSRCLEACPEWELVKPAAFAERWKHFGSAKWKHVGKKCFYAKPEVDLTDGFFVAVFERRESALDEAAERVHDPDRDFLEEIHRNFTRKPGQGKVAEGEEEEEYYEEEYYEEEYQPVAGNPFDNNAVEQKNSVPKIKEEPFDREPVTVPAKKIATTPEAEVIAEIETSVTEKKKKKKSKQLEVEAIVAAVVEEPIVKKKKRKHQNTETPISVEATAAVDPLQLVEPKKKKKKSSKQENEDILAEPVAEIATDELSSKKKKKKHNKHGEEEVLVAPTEQVAVKESSSKKKKKKDV